MAIVYSFDVFDTALVRRTAFPSDVFRLVAQRITGEIGCPANREFIEDFVASRLQAEQISLAGREETMAAGRVANRHMSKRNLNYRIVKQANDRSQRPHPAQA